MTNIKDFDEFAALLERFFEKREAEHSKPIQESERNRSGPWYETVDLTETGPFSHINSETTSQNTLKKTVISPSFARELGLTNE